MRNVSQRDARAKCEIDFIINVFNLLTLESTKQH